MYIQATCTASYSLLSTLKSDLVHYDGGTCTPMTSGLSQLSKSFSLVGSPVTLSARNRTL